MRPIPAPRLGDTHGLLRAINQRERLRLDEFITEFSLEELFPPGLENALGRTRQFVSFARSAGLLKEDRGVVELTEVGKRYVRSGDASAVFDVSPGQAEWLRRQLGERHMTDSIYHGAAIGLSLYASNPPGFHASRLDFGRALAHLGRAGWDNENTLESQGERYTTFLRDLELINDEGTLTETGNQVRSELTLPIHASLRDLAGQLNPGGPEAAEADGEREWAATGGEAEPEAAAVEPAAEEAPAEVAEEPDSGEYEEVRGGATEPSGRTPAAAAGGRPVPPSDVWDTAAPDEATRAYSAIKPDEQLAADPQVTAPRAIPGAPTADEEEAAAAETGMTSGDPLAASGMTSGDPLAGATTEPHDVAGPGVESPAPEVAADAAEAETEAVEPEPEEVEAARAGMAAAEAAAAEAVGTEAEAEPAAGEEAPAEAGTGEPVAEEAAPEEAAPEEAAPEEAAAEGAPEETAPVAAGEAGSGEAVPEEAAAAVAPEEAVPEGAAAGEVAAGEPAAGEVAAGEVAAGEVAAGEVAVGEVEAGEVAPGEVAPGEVAAGELAAGEVEAGGVAAGEAVPDEAAPDEAAPVGAVPADADAAPAADAPVPVVEAPPEVVGAVAGVDDEAAPAAPARPPTDFLDLGAVRAAAEASGLDLPDGVYAAVVAALASGKHLVITGPAGSGKTTLALAIAKAAVQAGRSAGAALATASPKWTAHDTVGRVDETGFTLGHVLGAAGKKKWLVVDELDRAKLDKAFGDLSSFLGGLPLSLPDGSREVAAPKEWRIVATADPSRDDGGTSPALLRRFAHIHLSRPDRATLEAAVDHAAEGDATAAAAVKRLVAIDLPELGAGPFIDAARHAAERNALAPATEDELAREALAAYIAPHLRAEPGRLEAIEREL